MTDQPQPIEIESTKDPSLNAIIARLRSQGVDPDTAELRMGYIRTPSPLLGDIRAAAVIAIDGHGRIGEVVHMPIDQVDPITLDEQLIERVLLEEIANNALLGIEDVHRLAHQIVVAVRAGTTPTPKES